VLRQSKVGQIEQVKIKGWKKKVKNYDVSGYIGFNGMIIKKDMRFVDR
jgi:hypothetical protein